MSTAYEKFYKTHTEVERLFDVHSQLTEGVKGRNRHLTKPVLKASIILMTSALEAFVEDLILESAEELLAAIDDPEQLPKLVKQDIIRRMDSGKDHLRWWLLAGDGWRKAYLDEVQHCCEGLNTPNSKNIRRLFKMTLGVDDVTEWWGWQGMRPSQAAAKLDRLISLRGTLAHGREPKEALSVNLCISYNNLVISLAEIMAVNSGAAVDMQLLKEPA